MAAKVKGNRQLFDFATFSKLLREFSKGGGAEGYHDALEKHCCHRTVTNSNSKTFPNSA